MCMCYVPGEGRPLRVEGVAFKHRETPDLHKNHETIEEKGVDGGWTREGNRSHFNT